MEGHCLEIAPYWDAARGLRPSPPPGRGPGVPRTDGRGPESRTDPCWGRQQGCTRQRRRGTWAPGHLSASALPSPVWEQLDQLAPTSHSAPFLDLITGKQSLLLPRCQGSLGNDSSECVPPCRLTMNRRKTECSTGSWRIDVPQGSHQLQRTH